MDNIFKKNIVFFFCNFDYLKKKMFKKLEKNMKIENFFIRLILSY